MAEPSTNPYPGPRPFLAGERLYGREREVTRLFYLLSAERVVVLHSPSGAGKSSLVSAALVPRLRAEEFDVWPSIRLSQPAANGGNRFVASAVASLEEGLPPGRRRPAGELADVSLAGYVAGRPRRPGAPSSVVLVFDQFEEILTLDPLGLEVRREFFRQLGEALENPEIWALFALREDYLGALDPYRDEVPTRLGNAFRIDLLTSDAATEAIVQPARDAAREFAPEAAARLASDLATISVQRPDGSFEKKAGLYVEPLQLQVVCRRLWEQLPQQTRTIGVENLLASGDVDAALAAYYDGSVGELADGDVPVERGLREWFSERLITPGGIRGQVLREQSSSGGLDNGSIDRLVATHLVRSEERDGKTWYELAHDRLVAPVRGSNTAWLEAHLQPMQRQAALWEREGRPHSLLERGKELRHAERWAANHPDALLPREAAFLAASRRRRRSTRVKLGALVLVTALVTVAALAFLREWRNAVRAQQAAHSQALASHSQALASESGAALSTAPQTALADAVEAVRVRQTPQAEAALREAILANPVAYVTPPVPDAGRVAASILRTSFPGGTFGTLVFSHPVDEALAFSADGRFLLGRALDGSVRLWRAADGRALRLPGELGLAGRLRSAGEGIVGVGFAGDTPLALVRGHGAPAVLNLATGRPLAGGAAGPSGMIFQGYENRVFALEHGRLTPRTGTWSVSVAEANTAVTVERSATRRVLATIPGFGNNFAGVAAVPVGDTLFEGTPFVPGDAFSADGRLLAVANADGIVRVWELSTLQQVMAFRAGWVSALAFAPSGGLLAAMTWDGSVVVARTNVRGVLPGLGVTINPTGRLIAVGGGVPGPARLSSPDGKLESVLVPPGNPCGQYGTQATFSPDGSAVAATMFGWTFGPPVFCADRLVKGRAVPFLNGSPVNTGGAAVWRVGSRAPRREIWPGTSGVLPASSTELGREGALFVDGGGVWSTRTGARVRALDGTLALSRDGRLALVLRAGRNRLRS